MRRLSPKNVFYLLLVVVALTGIRWIMMPTVRPHQGDGEFKNISWRFPYPYFGLPIAGYTIDFPRFDLAKEFHDSYRLADLPILENQPMIYLAVTDPDKRWRDAAARRKLTARVQFEVRDEQGKLVYEVDQSLGKMIWADPEGGKGSYGVYMLEPRFIPRGGARYLLRVHYTPDSALSGMEGFVHIRCGGSI
jgi:hypothetical protein